MNRALAAAVVSLALAPAAHAAQFDLFFTNSFAKPTAAPTTGVVGTGTLSYTGTEAEFLGALVSIDTLLNTRDLAISIAFDGGPSFTEADINSILLDSVFLDVQALGTGYAAYFFSDIDTGGCGAGALDFLNAGSQCLTTGPGAGFEGLYQIGAAPGGYIAVSAADVPLPAGAALLPGALGLLALARRRRA